MKKLVCILFSVMVLVMCTGCDKKQENQNSVVSVTSSISSEPETSMTSVTSSESNKKRLEVPVSVGNDKLIEYALNIFTPEGTPITKKQQSLAQRAVDIAFFLDETNCEAFIMNYYAEDGESFPNPDNPDDEAYDYHEIKKFKKKLGDDTYTVSDYKSFKKLMECISTGDVAKEYLFDDDGESIFGSNYIEKNGKLFTQHLFCGSRYYGPQVQIERAVLIEEQADKIKFSIPIAMVHVYIPGYSEEFIGRLEWYEFGMLKVDGEWRLSSIEESTTVSVNYDKNYTVALFSSVNMLGSVIIERTIYQD